MKQIILLYFSLCSFFLISAQKTDKIELIDNISARGCENFRVLRKVKLNGKKNTFIILDFVAEKLKLTENFQTFNLGNSTVVSGLVEILNTEKEDNYCTDGLSINVKTLKSIKIKKGIVKVKKIKDENTLERYGNIPYRVDVILQNVFFKVKRKKYFIEKIEFKNVLVSFIMG